VRRNPGKKGPATSLHPQPGVHKSGTLTPSSLKPKPDSDKLTPDSWMLMITE